VLNSASYGLVKTNKAVTITRRRTGAGNERSRKYGQRRSE